MGHTFIIIVAFVAHLLPGLLGLSNAFFVSVLGANSSAIEASDTSSGSPTSNLLVMVTPIWGATTLIIAFLLAAYIIRSLTFDPDGTVEIKMTEDSLLDGAV